ncbi:MAG: SDR family oxidoreductase [Dehalococcoidia bacterium]|nr:SDR family oxidoreductase [Dehalococcoidia bacterium]
MRAIVTGAASGIGAATAGLFASEGGRVLAVDLPGTGLAEAHAGQPNIVSFEANIAAEAAGKEIVAAAIERFGGLDILVNNAGTGSNALAEVLTIEEWDRVFAVNIRGMFLLCQAAIPALRESGHGRIVNVASVMAERTDYGLSAYAASKAGVAGLTRTLALELGKFGITANYILPGAIYTGMTRQNFDQDHIRQVWERKSPLKRLGQGIDIARGILFLASEDGGFVTGHGLVIDGGLTLRT